MDIVHSKLREGELGAFYYEGGYGRGVDVLRFFLAMLVCIVSFGFPTVFNESIPDFSHYAETLCSFIVPAFFILSGFFVLPQDEKLRREKLGRAVKRSGLYFLCLTVVLLILAYFYYVLINYIRNPQAGFGNFAGYFLREFRDLALSKRAWFEFIVLCKWPFDQGFSIWFVQSMFYGYVFLWILDRLKAWRFYKVILIITLLFGFVTVEMSGFIPFDFLGYTSIPIVKVLTYSIPFMLLGAFLRENATFLMRVPPLAYWGAFLLGFGITFGELSLLIHFGKVISTNFFIGSLISALAICGWSLVHPDCKNGFLSNHGRSYARRIYLLSQPVAILLILLINFLATRLPNVAQMLYQYSSLFILLICFLLALLIGWIRFIITDARREMEEIRDQEQQIRSFSDGQQNSNEVKR